MATPPVAEAGDRADVVVGARRLAQMDREMRAGNWLRDDGMQLTGKTLGLIGFGGIAAEVAASRSAAA